jgi:hypothetical protein
MLQPSTLLEKHNYSLITISKHCQNENSRRDVSEWEKQNHNGNN